MFFDSGDTFIVQKVESLGHFYNLSIKYADMWHFNGKKKKAFQLSTFSCIH